MPIPEDESRRNDVIDFLIDGMQDVNEKINDDGTKEKVATFNPEIAWFKGHIINQPFGRHALLIKRFEHLAKQCFNYMYYDRAVVMSQGILDIVDDYKRSIDAKSSEIWKDANNSQSSLVHILSRNKVERQYTLKGDTKRTMMDGILGRDKNKDEEE